VYSANVDELSDLVFALGVTITAITRHSDPWGDIAEVGQLAGLDPGVVYVEVAVE
jgi:hypothetical protein